MLLVEQSDPERDPKSLRVSPIQRRVLEAPEECDLFLGGGRGGGKSWAAALLILRTVEQHRENARVLYLRRTYPGLRDFEGILREVFGLAYPTATYNAGDRCWRGLPGEAHVELGQLEDESQFAKFQGRSSVKTWLTKILHNRIVDYIRKDSRERLVFSDEDLEMEGADEYNDAGGINLWRSGDGARR